MGTNKHNISVKHQLPSLQDFKTLPALPTPGTQQTTSAQRLKKKLLFIVPNAKLQLLIFMIVLYAAVNYLSVFDHATSSLVSDVRRMIFVANLFVIYIGVLVLPEPSKQRGSALFWKVVQASAVAYVLNIFAWLFFSKDNLQIMLRDIFDSNLGKPLGEKSYAEDCRVFTPENPTSYFYNIVSSVDMFVAAHFLGWTFKIIIFRNSAMAWTLSVGFEIMEWTMEVWLPNFKECWWDHFLFDLFGCNLIGMLIGQWAINKFKMRKLSWFVERTDSWDQLSYWEKFKYCFTVREEHKISGKWHWLSELWCFNAVIWYGFLNLYLDLSYFYNKSSMEIPPPHWLCSVRIWILASFAIIASNDYYDYVVNRFCTSMTLPIFVIHAIMILEGLLFLKNIKPGLFDSPLHYQMRVFWIIAGVAMAATQLVLIFEKSRRSATNIKKLK